MKLIDLLPTVEKTDYNRKNINIGVIVDALGINYDSFYRYDKICERIKAYWLMPRICTDTMVGVSVYFFDETLIGYSIKVARKSEEEFLFVSEEVANNVLDFFLSLIDKGNNFNIATTEQLNEELEVNGFNVYYSSSICSEKLFYVPTSEYVEVTNLFSYDYTHPYDELEVRFSNGERKIINCEDILVPYCLRKDDE